MINAQKLNCCFDPVVFDLHYSRFVSNIGNQNYAAIRNHLDPSANILMISVQGLLFGSHNIYQNQNQIYLLLKCRSIHSFHQIYIMSYLQLLKNNYTLLVQTQQILQDQMVTSNSDIVLFYEDHCQLWNIDVQKRNIYFWTCATPISPTKFIFVCLENCQPYLGTFDFDGNVTTKLCDLPKQQENFTKTYYLQNTKQILIQSRGKNHRLLVWNGYQLLQREIDQSSMVNQFNQNSVAIYSLLNKTLSFQILRDGSVKTYKINGLNDGVITVVKEYLQNQAIIGVVHNNKTTSIVNYSLVSGDSIKKTQTVDFPIDNILKLSDSWIAMCTTEDQHDSSLKIQPCFIEGDNKVKICQIERWIRNWNDYIPIVTLGHSQNDEQQKIARVQVVKCTSKKSIYTWMMEKLGLTSQFGQQIVKATINNFK